MSKIEEIGKELFNKLKIPTPEEAEVINEYVKKVTTGVNFYDLMGIPPACRNCGNHPVNGGSGICHCTLGSPVIN